MEPACDNRLTVMGRRSTLRELRRGDWSGSLDARHIEPWELSPGREVWLFATDNAPISRLVELSRCWPALVFLLDYELQSQRIKGLVKARAGKIESCAIGY